MTASAVSGWPPLLALQLKVCAPVSTPEIVTTTSFQNAPLGDVSTPGLDAVHAPASVDSLMFVILKPYGAAAGHAGLPGTVVGVVLGEPPACSGPAMTAAVAPRTARRNGPNEVRRRTDARMVVPLHLRIRTTAGENH